MEFHPLHATVQLPSRTTVRRPDNQVNVAACIAAMEAMYKRTFGPSLDLSEQYAFQLGKIGDLYGT